MSLKPEDLRKAMVTLKMKPTKEKLDVFYEYLVILIEDLHDDVRRLRLELTGDGRTSDRLSDDKAKDSNIPPAAV